MSAAYDLLVTDARLADGSPVALGIRDGRYAHVGATAPEGARAARTIDAGGGLVTESFVNGHMHLEKVHTLDRAGDGALAAYTSGNMGAALRSIVREASQVKRQYDRDWLEPNIRRALDAAVAHGVLHIQAFVDVDTTARLVGMEAVLAVREEYRDLLDLQVVAFPQDGLLRDPGAAELCEEALRMGADVVGGIPWIEMTDAEAQAHVSWACRLAAEQGRRVAMLVDDAGDPGLRTTQMLAESMLEHGLEGRGVACHARALATYPQPTLQRLMDLSQAAGLGFVSDPHTGPLHLPVREFLEDGIPVALGQDDIEDAYYPFGRHSMLEVAFLAAHTLRFLTGADQRLLLDMITTRAADVLGVPDHAIGEGNPANLCIHPDGRLRDVLTEHARPRWVIREGRVVAESETTTRLQR
ncbi:amidohydrolase family protein [Nocardioides sp. LHD-245]|uniref:amidohydrolase family protein n=1 Tax=Nocardioides sp. LHD-245 TaxID=3051387 RepID=UPI0027DFA692|nr:amidohydrolase family protein [Nocardioides sp. LHD-245]